MSIDSLANAPLHCCTQFVFSIATHARILRAELRENTKRILAFTKALQEKGYKPDVGRGIEQLKIVIKIAKTGHRGYYYPGRFLNEYLELDRYNVFMWHFKRNREKALAHLRLAEDMFYRGQTFHAVDYLIFRLKEESPDSYVLLPKRAPLPEGTIPESA